MDWYHQDVKVINGKKWEEVELGYDQQLTPNSLRRGQNVPAAKCPYKMNEAITGIQT